jgi:hypothetical protein
MDWDERLRSLGRFGLSEREARLYLALLERGRATARELSREAKLERVLGYRTLDAMRARGIVELTAERPRRYSPVPPSVVFERDLRGRRSLVSEDEAMAQQFLVDLVTRTALPPTAAPRYQILTGSARVYDYLREMVDRAEREIATMMTFRALRESLEHGLQDRLGKFIRGGGRFRLILEADPRLSPTLQRFNRSLRRFPRAEVRPVTPQPVRMTLVDGNEAILFLVPEAKDRHADHVAVWTDNTEFVAGQRLFFDAAWEAAGPRAKPPFGPGSGRVVPARIRRSAPPASLRG